MIIQLSLFGRSVPEEYWNVNADTTIIAYFFRPFALATTFNITANKLNDEPIDLSSWSPHKINALKTQLIYAASTSRKIEVLDNLLIHQLKQNKKECEIIQI